MPFMLTSAQALELQALRDGFVSTDDPTYSPSANYSVLYDKVIDFMEEFQASGNFSTLSEDEKTEFKILKIWFASARDINLGVGPVSAFIREYNAAQALLQHGKTITDAQMDRESDLIVLRVIDDILLKHPSSFPSIADLAGKDVATVATNLLEGDPSGWAGNPSLLSLGYDAPFNANIIGDRSDAYDVLAMTLVLYEVLDDFALDVALFLTTGFGTGSALEALRSIYENAPDYASVFPTVQDELTDAIDASLDLIDRHYGIDALDLAEFVFTNDLQLGSVGNDTITADNNDDKLIHGGDGNDHITGGSGDDIIDGGDGNDTIIASRGNDTLMGGAGNDRYVIDHTVFSSSDIANITINDSDGIFEISLVGLVASDFNYSTLIAGDAIASYWQQSSPIISEIVYNFGINNIPDFDANAYNATYYSLQGINTGLGFGFTVSDIGYAAELAPDKVLSIYLGNDILAEISIEVDDASTFANLSVIDLINDGYLSVNSQSHIWSFDLSSFMDDEPPDGTSGNDNLTTGSGPDMISLGGGSDTLRGALEDFFGDTVADFSTDDELIFTGSQIDRGAITVTQGSAILAVDSDGDGNANGSFTLQGDFSGGDFMAVVGGSDTTVTYETFLPTLQEGQAVDASLVNGINNQAFLTGDGSTGFQVTLRDMGFAGYNNVVGVYEIDASGNIVDTRILFANANADKTAQATITGVEAGHQLGFFLVQDAANWAATLAAGDSLSFINSSGTAGNIADGSNLSIAVNGVAVDEMVFHSFAASMNSDGVQHALSGVDAGGQSITVGFEDLTGGGDLDYEDVAFTISTFDII